MSGLIMLISIVIFCVAMICYNPGVFFPRNVSDNKAGIATQNIYNHHQFNQVMKYRNYIVLGLHCAHCSG